MDWKRVQVVTPDQIPDGAVRVHLYNVENVLRPRGHMKKESVGVYVKDSLDGAYESWTDPKYGDTIDPKVLLKLIHQNLMEEINGAFGQFLGEVATGNPDAVRDFIENSLPD